MKENKIITFDDLKDEIEKNCDVTKQKYFTDMVNARKTTANIMVKNYMALHPEATKEEVLKYANDYLEQTPSEFERNLRINANFIGTIFNSFQAMINEFVNFKELYIALNAQKLEAITNKELKRQQKEQEKKEEIKDNKIETIKLDKKD